MYEEQRTYLRQVGETGRKELLIKHTGREGIDLPTHEHAQYQIAYTLQGTLRLTVEEIQNERLTLSLISGNRMPILYILTYPPIVSNWGSVSRVKENFSSAS